MTLRVLRDAPAVLDSDPTALDLDDGDVESGAEHQNVDLDVLVISGQTLAVNHRRLVGKLLAQGISHCRLDGGTIEIRLSRNQRDHKLRLAENGSSSQQIRILLKERLC